MILLFMAMVFMTFAVYGFLAGASLWLCMMTVALSLFWLVIWFFKP